MIIRIGIADDQLLVREAVSEMLEHVRGFHVVAVCSDADAMRKAVDEHEPHVVVTGIRMGPDMTDDGIRLAAELRHTHPETAVVVLSGRCDPVYALALFEAGSDRRAYILKDRLRDRAQLEDTVRRVAQGGSVVDPKVVEALVRFESHHPGAALDSLSPSEQEILSHMSHGESNARIADQLGLTKRAVEKHINAMFAKLELPVAPDVSRRVRAVLIYLAHNGSRRYG